MIHSFSDLWLTVELSLMSDDPAVTAPRIQQFLITIEYDSKMSSYHSEISPLTYNKYKNSIQLKKGSLDVSLANL